MNQGRDLSCDNVFLSYIDCWQSVFLTKFSRDYEERLFSLKENGTRHGCSTPSSLLGHTAMPLFCVRDARVVITKHSSIPGVQVTLREKSDCKQTMSYMYCTVYK